MRTLRPRFVGMTIAIPGGVPLGACGCAAAKPPASRPCSRPRRPHLPLRRRRREPRERGTSRASNVRRRPHGRPCRSSRSSRPAGLRRSRGRASRTALARCHQPRRRPHRGRSPRGRGRHRGRRRRRESCVETTARRCGEARRPGPCTSCSWGRRDAFASAACRSGRPGRAASSARAVRGACRASTSMSFASERP